MIAGPDVLRSNALADLLVIDGNSLENIDLIANPEKNLVLTYTDTLGA